MIDAPPAIAVPHGPARGIVLEVHGGGWRDLPTDPANALRYVRARWTARGYQVEAIHYADRDGAQAVQDIVDRFDALKAARPDVRIIFAGQSAGAHLALAAASRRRPYAVIAEGTVSDLTDDALHPSVLQSASEAFSRPSRWNLARMRLLPRGKRVLLSASDCDPLVPNQQSWTLAMLKRVRYFRVPCGRSRPYTHAYTTERGWQKLMAQERATIR